MEVEKKAKELVECPRCHGHGWVHVYSLLAENPCPVCKGKGKVTQKQAENYERISKNTD
jgi:DnaJ-class molecular chaperone